MLDRLKAWFRGQPAAAPVTKGSTAERTLMRLFPGYRGTQQQWSQNRFELAGHYRGWNYVGIKAIAEEIAGMAPQVAYVRDQGQAVHGKYLPRWLRSKALAPVQMDDELEPVDKNHDLLRLL